MVPLGTRSLTTLNPAIFQHRLAIPNFESTLGLDVVPPTDLPPTVQSDRSLLKPPLIQPQAAEFKTATVMRLPGPTSTYLQQKPLTSEGIAGDVQKIVGNTQAPRKEGALPMDTPFTQASRGSPEEGAPEYENTSSMPSASAKVSLGNAAAPIISLSEILSPDPTADRRKLTEQDVSPKSSSDSSPAMSSTVKPELSATDQIATQSTFPSAPDSIQLKQKVSFSPDDLASSDGAHHDSELPLPQQSGASVDGSDALLDNEASENLTIPPAAGIAPAAQAPAFQAREVPPTAPTAASPEFSEFPEFPEFPVRLGQPGSDAQPGSPDTSETVQRQLETDALVAKTGTPSKALVADPLAENREQASTPTSSGLAPSSATPAGELANEPTALAEPELQRATRSKFEQPVPGADASSQPQAISKTDPETAIETHYNIGLETASADKSSAFQRSLEPVDSENTDNPFAPPPDRADQQESKATAKQNNATAPQIPIQSLDHSLIQPFRDYSIPLSDNDPLDAPDQPSGLEPISILKVLGQKSGESLSNHVPLVNRNLDSSGAEQFSLQQRPSQNTQVFNPRPIEPLSSAFSPLLSPAPFIFPSPGAATPRTLANMTQTRTPSEIARDWNSLTELAPLASEERLPSAQAQAPAPQPSVSPRTIDSSERQRIPAISPSLTSLSLPNLHPLQPKLDNPKGRLNPTLKAAMPDIVDVLSPQTDAPTASSQASRGPASPEAIEKLANHIYQLVKQRLIISQERHGYYPKRLG